MSILATKRLFGFKFSTLVLCFFAIHGCGNSNSTPNPPPTEAVAPEKNQAPPSKESEATGPVVSDTSLAFTTDSAGTLGVLIADSSSPPGAMIIEVKQNSEAEKSGLHANDVITKLNDQDIRNSEEFREVYNKIQSKVSVGITVLHGGNYENIDIITP